VELRIRTSVFNIEAPIVDTELSKLIPFLQKENTPTNRATSVEMRVTPYDISKFDGL
jgi:hypothetical protein